MAGGALVDGGLAAVVVAEANRAATVALGGCGRRVPVWLGFAGCGGRIALMGLALAAGFMRAVACMVAVAGTGWLG